MNSSQTEPSPLWESLRQEADRQPGYQEDTFYSRLTGPPVTIVDKFQRAWQGGPLPLLIVSVGLILLRGLQPYGSDSARLSFDLINICWIAAVLGLSWLLAPLLRDRQGLRPSALLATGLGLAWYLPASTAVVFLLAEMTGLVEFEAYSDPWRHLFLARRETGILLYLVLMMALFFLARRIRSNTPWYDGKSFSPSRFRSAWIVVALPPLAYFCFMIVALPGSTVLDWERSVRSAQPQIVGLADYQGDESAGSWSLLKNRRATESLRELEGQALSIGETEPPEGWTWSEHSDAKEVLRHLLERKQYLQRSVEVLCLYFELSALDGVLTQTGYLDDVLKPMVLEAEAGPRELEKAHSRLQSLLESCPDRVTELDSRIYLRDSIMRPPSTLKKLARWMLYPPLLERSLRYKTRTRAWIRIRPELARGVSWKELTESPDQELADSVRVLDESYVKFNQQDSLVPAIETWLLLIEIRLWEREKRAFPSSLEAFESYAKHPGRWRWTKGKLGWELHEDGDSYPKVWSFR